MVPQRLPRGWAAPVSDGDAGDDDDWQFIFVLFVALIPMMVTSVDDSSQMRVRKKQMQTTKSWQNWLEVLSWSCSQFKRNQVNCFTVFTIIVDSVKIDPVDTINDG